MAVSIISAEVGEDGTARLVARDKRLGLEAVVFVATDGNSWIFERNRNAAADSARGRSGGSAPLGLRIRHADWEPIPDASAAAG